MTTRSQSEVERNGGCCLFHTRSAQVALGLAGKSLPLSQHSERPALRRRCTRSPPPSPQQERTFGLIFVCSDYNLSYAASLQRPKGMASVSNSADRRQEGEMLGAGGPSRSQGPSPEETGPRTRSGHRLGHQQPLLAEWK